MIPKIYQRIMLTSNIIFWNFQIFFIKYSKIYFYCCFFFRFFIIIPVIISFILTLIMKLYFFNHVQYFIKKNYKSFDIYQTCI